MGISNGIEKCHTCIREPNVEKRGVEVKYMKVSAKNLLNGKVSNITMGAVNAEIEVELGDGQKIVSIITSTSAKKLGLEVGKEVYAMIKASNVMIAVD